MTDCAITCPRIAGPARSGRSIRTLILTAAAGSGCGSTWCLLPSATALICSAASVFDPLQSGCRWRVILVFIASTTNVAKQYDVAFVGNVFPLSPAQSRGIIQRRYRNSFVGQRYFDEMARTYWGCSHCV